jgi:hypothetical protein
MASKAVENIGQFTDVLTGTTSTPETRQEVVSFIAGGSIAAGDWVALDSSQTGPNRVNTVVKAGVVATGNPNTIGCALTTQTVTGGIVQVVIAGYHPTAAVLTAVTAGTALIGGKTTAGRAADIATGSLSQPCGVALGTAVSNVGPVWVIKQF